MLELNLMLLHIQQPLRSKPDFIFVHLKGVIFHNLKIAWFLTYRNFSFGLQVCVESKNFTQALKLYEEMKSYETHPNLVSELLSCCTSIFHKIINLNLSSNSMQFG
jgi:pentatricopeptide repeat protein